MIFSEYRCLSGLLMRRAWLTGGLLLLIMVQVSAQSRWQKTVMRVDPVICVAFCTEPVAKNGDEG